MTTDRELAQKLRELELAKLRLDLRVAKRRQSAGKQTQSALKQPQSMVNRSQSVGKQPQSTAQQRERDLNSVRVLRQALENPDLPAYGRRTMENSLRRFVRTLEGKPPTVGNETATGREAR